MYPLILIFVIVLSIIVSSIILATDSFFKANYEKAGTVVAIGSSASTILLVLLTGWYSFLTRELVLQAEKDREQQRELRKKEKSEEWYTDLLYHLRMIQNIWSHEYARPNGVTEDGELYISIQSNTEFWKDLAKHFEVIPQIVGRRPPHVDQNISDMAHDLHIQWVLMTDIDIGGEPIDPRILESHSLIENVENLEEQIMENQL